MTDLTGQSLGRYHLVEQLGEGGMAAVYRARDLNLERDVAVKVIRTDVFGSTVMEQLLKRFQREGRALGKLTHPNIVPILDYGEHEGVPYLVMPYLPGGTLKQRYKGPMPYRDAVQLLIPIAQALVHAHQQGIIHRDIKPANILITSTGEPMLSDFGIARIIQSEETQGLTTTGVGIGTPEYMAPEQGMGQADERSDIYALGILLYELVTGRIPFHADTPMAILLKKSQEPLPRPSQYVPDLPYSVETCLIKALERDPDHRNQTMKEFLDALRRLGREESRTLEVLDTQPGFGRIGSRTVEMPPPKRNHTYWILAGIGGIITLFICALGAFAIYRLILYPPQSAATPPIVLKPTAGEYPTPAPANTNPVEYPTSVPANTIPVEYPTVVIPPSETPSPLQDVIARRTTSSEVNTLPSIWFVSGIKNPGDISSPGTKSFEASIDPSSDLLWVFYWCASDQGTLNKNISRTTVDMLINNVSLAQDQIYQVDDRSSDGKWYCRNWYTTLREWRSGANIQLTIHYSFSQRINDGYTYYPAGNYYIQLKVSVR